MTEVECKAYFECEFEKKVNALMNEYCPEDKYTREHAIEDATYFFLNNSMDFNAVAGMYLGYSDGDRFKAIKNFLEEVDEDTASFRDRGVIRVLATLE